MILLFNKEDEETYWLLTGKQEGICLKTDENVSIVVGDKCSLTYEHDEFPDEQKYWVEVDDATAKKLKLETL